MRRTRMDPRFDEQHLPARQSPPIDADGYSWSAPKPPSRPATKSEEEDSPYALEIGWLKWRKWPVGLSGWIAWLIEGLITGAMLVVLIPIIEPRLREPSTL